MNDSASETRYIVLADVVDSRNISNREAFEPRLKNALEYVNETERENISTPFTQMKGIDEFGCVLTRLSPLPDVVSELLDRIHPSSVRFAVASGEIDVGNERETVAQMDGPAFHRASELLDEVEERGLYMAVDTGREIDDLVATSFDLLLLERERLTERQIEVVLAYEKYGTQSEASEELGMQQQGVSNALHRANYMRRKKIRSCLRRTLEDLYE